MRRNRWLPLALAALLCLGGCSGRETAAQRHRVTLVAKSTQTEFWLSVFAGAEAAAAEYNLELTIAGPETEEDYESQNRMIAGAVEAGAEALVFSAIDFEENAPAVEAAGQAGVKIVSIDSGVGSDQVGTYIGTDNYAAGRMAAQAALEQVEGALRVGLVNYDEGTANGQQREQGAVDALQAGSVDALIVQNPYAMGYLGVESAYQLLSGRGGELPPVVDTSTQIVYRSNLFTLDSQKALFAFE